MADCEFAVLADCFRLLINYYFLLIAWFGFAGLGGGSALWIGVVGAWRGWD